MKRWLAIGMALLIFVIGLAAGRGERVLAQQEKLTIPETEGMSIPKKGGRLVGSGVLPGFYGNRPVLFFEASDGTIRTFTLDQKPPVLVFKRAE